MTAAVPGSVETLHLPYRIERRIAELYFQLFAALLDQQGYTIDLKDIEPDDLDGWHIRFTCDVDTETVPRSCRAEATMEATRCG